MLFAFLMLFVLTTNLNLMEINELYFDGNLLSGDIPLIIIRTMNSILMCLQNFWLKDVYSFVNPLPIVNGFKISLSFIKLTIY